VIDFFFVTKTTVQMDDPRLSFRDEVRPIDDDSSLQEAAETLLLSVTRNSPLRRLRQRALVRNAGHLIHRACIFDRRQSL
jgi:hypothetical protein